jgi:DNA invertase Pin-like site-specific DNA recombinase
MKNTNPLEGSDEPKIKYCLYARKSSESDEQQALSIDSQAKEMLQLAQREGLDVVDIKRESHSAKSTGQRPVFNELITDLKEGKFNAILAWHPDRLSRNAGDLGAIVDLMDEHRLIEVRTFGQKFTNSPSEKFLLMILCSQAKLENDNKGVNVKRGLRAKVEMGLWPCVAPTGYINDRMPGRAGYVLVDPVRAPIIKQIFEKVGNERWSARTVYKWMVKEGKFNSVRKGNKALTLSTIYRLLHQPFYSGTFEYPTGSGNWYKGQHEALVSKELFERVQQKIAEELKSKKQYQEFTFTNLMLCGYCGSGITAQSKDKNLKDGSVRSYIYYNCTHNKDHFCKNPFIREEELIKQIDEIFDKIDIDELGTRHIIEREVARYNKIRAKLLGAKENDKALDVDVRNYAKYMLKEGTMIEKRELLGCLKNRIVLKDKKITLGAMATV